MRTPLTIALAAALGASATLVGIALADDGISTTAATSTSSTATTVTSAEGPWWYDAHETLVGPAAVVLETLTVDDGEATLTYRVEQITTAGLDFVLESDDIPPAAPQDWELVTATGVYEGSSSRASARQVRIPVDDGVTADDITAIRVTRHWLRIPYQYVVDIDAVPGAETPLDEGVILTVDAVLEQADSALLHLDLVHPSEAFGATETADFWVLGSGSDWGPTNIKVGGGYSLTHFAPDLPDRVSLSIWSSRWIPFDAVTELDTGGLQRAG